MLYFDLPALHFFMVAAEHYFIESKFFRSTERKGREAKQQFAKVSADFSWRLGGLESQEVKSKDIQHSTRSLLRLVPALP